MLYALCLSRHSNTETVLIACLSQAEPPQRVNCLAPRWEIVLSVFPKDTATRYLIESKANVSKPFEFSIISLALYQLIYAAPNSDW